MAGALESQNPVLLGFPDEDIDDKSVIDFSVSKIGGLPVSNSNFNQIEINTYYHLSV